MQLYSPASHANSDFGTLGPDTSSDTSAIRMRERYINTRFRQVLRPGMSLDRASDVMHYVSNLLDDEQPHLAIEMVQLALEEDASIPSLWLCLVELAFITHQPILFGEAAEKFRQYFPNAPELATVDGLARQVFPADPDYQHARAPARLPGWSLAGMSERDEFRQNKLHEALVSAAADISHPKAGR